MRFTEVSRETLIEAEMHLDSSSKKIFLSLLNELERSH